MRSYTIYITPRAWEELRELPGNMRQRLRREIDALGTTPRPSASKALTLPKNIAAAAIPPTYELRRLRIDRWRVVYAMSEVDAVIDILTIKKRPPYDYGNLSELLTDL